MRSGRYARMHLDRHSVKSRQCEHGVDSHREILLFFDPREVYHPTNVRGRRIATSKFASAADLEAEVIVALSGTMERLRRPGLSRMSNYDGYPESDEIERNIVLKLVPKAILSPTDSRCRKLPHHRDNPAPSPPASLGCRAWAGKPIREPPCPVIARTRHCCSHWK